MHTPPSIPPTPIPRPWSRPKRTLHLDTQLLQVSLGHVGKSAVGAKVTLACKGETELLAALAGGAPLWAGGHWRFRGRLQGQRAATPPLKNLTLWPRPHKQPEQRLVRHARSRPCPGWGSNPTDTFHVEDVQPLPAWLLSPLGGPSLRNYMWVPEKVMPPLHSRPWPAPRPRPGACPLTWLSWLSSAP